MSDDFDEDADEDYELDEDDDDVTVACPYCGAAIYEDAERCPRCERYISSEDAPPARKPWWIMLGVIVCLYLVYRWIVGLGP